MGVSDRGKLLIQTYGIDAHGILSPVEVARESLLVKLVARYEAAGKLLEGDEPIGFARGQQGSDTAFNTLHLACARVALAPRQVVAPEASQRVIIAAESSVEADEIANSLGLTIWSMVGPGVTIAGPKRGPSPR
jgi:hypothetical protein